jgi:PAS domain S-box-containing protein
MLSVINDYYHFLRGGGEMGERTRNYKWDKTTIGSPDTWPQSLKTTVSILLTSRFPMFLWWGEELIQFYNDAYRPSLGNNGKHPSALGARGIETWPEIWAVIYPLIQRVLEDGEPTWSENQLIPIYRNGKLEDVYWTFSYSPVRNDAGHVEGVLVTCNETTSTIEKLRIAKQNEAELAGREKYFRNATDSMPAVLWTTDSAGQCTYLNKQWYEITGQTAESSLGLGWVSATHQDEQADLAEKFIAANTARKPFHAPYRLRQKDGSYRWAINKGTPRYDENGDYAGMIGTVTDVHDQYTAQMNAREILKTSEEKFRSLVEEAPVATCLFTGIDLVIEVANDQMLHYWGKNSGVIGQPLAKGVPELQGQPFLDILREVFLTGKTYEGKQEPAILLQNGVLTTRYFDYTYKPLLNADGEVYGIMDMAIDVTEQVYAAKRIQQSQQELLAYFDQSPVGIAVVDADELSFRMVNPFYAELVGRTKNDLVGKPLLKALPELAGQGFDELLTMVLTSGSPFAANEVAANILRLGQIETIYVDLLYQPTFGQNNEVSGILVVATDVTQQVRSRKKIEESEARFRLLIQEAPVATCLYVGREMRVELANEIMLNYWGKDSSIIGLPIREALPEINGQIYTEILERVYDTGVTYEGKASRAELVRNGVRTAYYFDVTYKPLWDSNGNVYAILDMAVEVTAQVVAMKELEESETKLRGIISSAPAGIGLFVGRDFIIENPNQTFIDIVGKGPGIVGLPLREAMPELLTEGQPFLKILDEVFTSGVMFQSVGSQVKIVQNGVMTYNYYNISYTPVFDDKGEVYAVLDIAIDVTDQVKAQQKLEIAESSLREAIELAELGTWSIDAKTGFITYSDRLVNWYGIDTANNPGLPFREIHNDDSERVKLLVEAALRPGSTGLLDAEYTAVNLITGQERIIHVQGKTVIDEAGSPVVLHGTSQDITFQRQHQLALQRQVDQRTEQLAAAIEELQATNEELEESNEQLMYSNDELAQYAYVASHDLQEPLRKIRVFTSRLKTSDTIDQQTKQTLNKISSAAERMTLLIQDLLNFSKLLQNDSMLRPVDLTDIVQAVTNDFELTIAEKEAQITIGQLPAIEAVGLQMNQLFFNLVSNSLKFVKPGTRPVITIEAIQISHEHAARYVRKPLTFSNYFDIVVTDNGIGFETQFSEQIFEVFKRLHGRDAYPGSGIGLSLCRRIAENHNGFLYAESTVGHGTRFHLIVPDKQQPAK